MVNDVFHVVAQCVREHETRSMLDGQIHNIEQVGRSIIAVKKDLEAQIGKELHEVCIAAAGRVLKTVTTKAEMEFPEEIIVDGENIYSLDMLGVEKAYEEFQRDNDLDTKFYCVGYTVVRYFLNDYQITSLERHKAKRIAVELIATFLPDEVVDGLYKAVEEAGLLVANLTLEPIAAIHVAIPLNYRMLNIALVDVGAGTSDISITRDGSIVAYGMIPMAGDELTEAIAQHCLVDFATAEKIKTAVLKDKAISYRDIMGLMQKINPKEVLKVTEPVMKKMTKAVVAKIKELNGGKPVAAVFVVGGGGKLPTYTDMLAKELGIDKTRVALRGEEELKAIVYDNGQPNTDSLFVTPIGICLNFYDAKNSFIFVNFNGERIKLYDNGRLLLVDAAIQAGFPNESLFPKRGPELNFTVDGKPHMVRGELGEPAVVKLNGEPVSINEPIKAGDKITVTESTEGTPGHMELQNVPGFNAALRVKVNDTMIDLPKFARVNGNLESGYYDLQDGDQVEMLDYYTVGQVAEFMDVILAKDMNIYVNNKLSDLDEKVYNNFSIIWTLEKLELSDVEKYGAGGRDGATAESFADLQADEDYKTGDALPPEDVKRPKLDGSEYVVGSNDKAVPEETAETETVEQDGGTDTETAEQDGELEAEAGEAEREEPEAETKEQGELTEAEEAEAEDEPAEEVEEQNGPGTETETAGSGLKALLSEGQETAGTLPKEEQPETGADAPSRKPAAADDNSLSMAVTVNDESVILTGKSSYIFVDVFEFYDFDLSKPQGRAVVTKLNGKSAPYAAMLHEGDEIQIYWED
ncbi:MAG: rod shape-determining protein [Lachnospiraceae bacterium]|nr:rod shape-determining protein [Lachnospiraceae bacterium]